MKLTDRGIRYGLIAMIAGSFFLSYKIWLSPNARSYLGDEQTALVTSSVNLRKASEVFLPTRITWVNNDEPKMLSSENAITKIHKLLIAGEYGKVNLKEYKSDQAFLEKADINQGVEFSYFGSFQLFEYQQMFKIAIDLEDLDGGKENFFTKVQLDFDTGKIRFVNPRRHQIYEASMKLDVSELTKELQAIEEPWMMMSRDNRLPSLQYQAKDKIQLKLYSYIASTQAYTVFRNAFFLDTENVKSSEESKDTVLYGGSETMRIQESSQIVEFQGPIEKNKDIQDDIYDQSYQYVSRLETNVGYLRFFDRSKDSITYRTFIEGYPVFGDAYQGEVSFNLKEFGTSQPQVDIYSSLNTIQIPIPSSELVTLDSSVEVHQSLLEKGAQADLLQTMVIGYQRQEVKNADGIVDMVPMWYLKYDDHWYSYADLVDKLTEKEGA